MHESSPDVGDNERQERHATGGLSFDTDIAAMSLSDGEKAGLQIFRNYSRSFERHAIKRFRESLDKDTVNVDDLTRIADLLVNEEVRFVPILVCAFADELLTSAFQTAVPDGVPGGKANLFSGYGPLSDLSKRIKMAFAFDVVSGDVAIGLDAIRTARNRIAHSWDIEDLGELFARGRVAQMFPMETLLAERANSEPLMGTQLGPHAAFRVRAIWLVGRLKYETCYYWLAKRARLDPARVLYSDGGTHLLTSIAAICMDATRDVMRSELAS